MEELTVWQTLRMQQLLRILRRSASNRSLTSESELGGESSMIVLQDVTVANATAARSFIDKAFDQLVEVGKLCRLNIEVYATRAGELRVTLWKVVDDGSTPTPLSVDEADELLDALASRLRTVLDVEAIANYVVGAASSLWVAVLGLVPTAPSDPMTQIASAAGVGGELDSSAIKAMLQAQALRSAQQPQSNTDDEVLMSAVKNLRVVVQTCEGSSALSSALHEAIITITLPPPAHDGGSTQLYEALVVALQHAARYWQDVSLQHPGFHAKGDELVPPMLLFAAVISAERKKKSSSLRFPLPLLDQVLVHLEAVDTTTLPWLHQESYEASSRFRINVEYPQAEDETPRDDETDEEYFERLRPKTYIDLCVSFLPRRKVQ